jgi:hypothetical protein
MRINVQICVRGAWQIDPADLPGGGNVSLIKMSRRVALLLFVLVCGCRSEMPASSGLDEPIAGWRRTLLTDLAPPSALDPVPAKAIRHAWRGSYAGSGGLDVRVYEVARPALALDLVQRLRPPADTEYFYFDHVYFVAIQWRNADRQAIRGFVRELENRLSVR